MLIECPECKKQVSDSAATCPHCGYAIARSTVAKTAGTSTASNNQRDSSPISWKLVAGLALFGIVGYFYLTSEDEGGSTRATTCNRGDAWLFAQQAVEGVLKNPDDADFHNPHGWEVKDDTKYPGQYIVTGEVTATNSFNAKIRQTFQAVVRCENGTWYTGRVTWE